MKCKICDLRKPRRYCPGVTGDICSICCGNEREQTVDCPIACTYLQEAHDHERMPEIDPANVPNPDIAIPEDFTSTHQHLMHYTVAIVFQAAAETTGAVDSDVRQALESLIRTYRTRATGLHYDSRPQNPAAAAIYEKIMEGVNTIQKAMIEKGVRSRDAEFLTALVYLQRDAWIRDNGRP